MELRLPSLRRVNVMYALVQMTYWSLFAAFSGYQTALLLGRGFSSGQAGVFTAIRCLAGIFAQPLLGGWADRHPEVSLNRLLNICLSAALAVNVLFYRTRPGFAGTALIFVVLGVLELNAYPLLDSMAVQFINVGLDVNYSLGRGLGSFAYAVTCVIMGRQAAALGVETVLVTHGALLVVLIGLIAVYPRLPGEVRRPPAETEPPHSVREIVTSSPAFTWMLAAVFFSMAGVMPIVGFMVNIITAHGGTEVHLGWALFLMGASELPAALLFPRLWRRMGSQGMMVLAVIFMAVKPLCFALAPSLGWVLAVQPIQMLGYGLFTPASVYYANENVSPADRVRGQTVMMIASNGLGSMVGNLLSGYAIDLGGIGAMLALCTACGVLGILCTAVSVRAGRKAR